MWAADYVNCALRTVDCLDNGLSTMDRGLLAVWTDDCRLWTVWTMEIEGCGQCRHWNVCTVDGRLCGIWTVTVGTLDSVDSGL